MAIERALLVGVIHARCDVCGEEKVVVDKGLGRASLATWETRHQHFEVTSDDD